MLLQYEKERRQPKEDQQDGLLNPIKSEDRIYGQQRSGSSQADALQMLRQDLGIQKGVVDEFTRKILQGEMRFLPLATSIIIHLTLMLHVRYYAAIGERLPSSHRSLSILTHLPFRGIRSRSPGSCDGCQVAHISTSRVQGGTDHENGRRH